MFESEELGDDDADDGEEELELSDDYADENEGDDI
jgi:hypothetical protein